MFLTWVTNAKPYVTPLLFGVIIVVIVYALLRLALLITRYKFLLRRSLVEVRITPPHLHRGPLLRQGNCS